jgi:SAM-dependent methyltransferase
LLPHLLEVVPPPATILDVGGGTGRMAIPLAQQGYEVTILEPAASGMLIAHQKAKATGVADRLHFVCGGVEDILLLAPETFDAVLGLQSILFLDDLRPALRNMLAICRKAIAFDVISLYGFIYGRMEGFQVTPETVECTLQTGRTPGEETIQRETFRCYTSGEVREVAEEAGVIVDSIAPLSFLEVLGWRGSPENSSASILESRFRDDPILREFSAFHLVMGRKAASG